MSHSEKCTTKVIGKRAYIRVKSVASICICNGRGLQRNQKGPVSGHDEGRQDIWIRVRDYDTGYVDAA